MVCGAQGGGGERGPSPELGCAGVPSGVWASWYCHETIAVPEWMDSIAYGIVTNHLNHTSFETNVSKRDRHVGRQWTGWRSVR